jgi:hypothetical protein
MILYVPFKQVTSFSYCPNSMIVPHRAILGSPLGGKEGMSSSNFLLHVASIWPNLDCLFFSQCHLSLLSSPFSSYISTPAFLGGFYDVRVRDWLKNCLESEMKDQPHKVLLSMRTIDSFVICILE